MADHVTRIEKQDPLGFRVKFGPKLREAFAELGAAVGHSEHFDQDMRAWIEEWASGEKVTVNDFMVALPSFAHETMRHLKATNDPRVEKIWETIADEISDPHAFTLMQVGKSQDGPA